MIWDSIVLMSMFDVFFISAAAITIYFLVRHARAIQFADARREFQVMTAGIVTWSLIYLTDLLIMVVGPLFMEQRQVMQAMLALHTEFRWVLDAIAAALLLTGFVGVVRKLSVLLSTLQKTTDTLEMELDSRTTLQRELKAEALTQRASNRSKSEFLVGISHELRTPLNGIIGLAGLLANTEMADDQRKLLTTLEQSAQAMLSRVNDVLDLSKLESGHVELRSVAFRPSELVSTVEALFRPLAIEKGLAVSTHASDSARRYVIGDALLIKQILCNLVSNAVKFTPAGSIKIVSDVTKAGTDRLWLNFTVIDTGVGLNDDEIEILSNPKSDTTVGEGGLGLSISWRLAQLMDGEISIDSEIEKGSAFTVRLQVQREPRTDAEEPIA